MLGLSLNFFKASMEEGMATLLLIVRNASRIGLRSTLNGCKNGTFKTRQVTMPQMRTKIRPAIQIRRVTSIKDEKLAVLNDEALLAKIQANPKGNR